MHREATGGVTGQEGQITGVPKQHLAVGGAPHDDGTSPRRVHGQQRTVAEQVRVEILGRRGRPMVVQDTVDIERH